MIVKKILAGIFMVFLSTNLVFCNNNVESEFLESVGNGFIPLRSSLNDSIVRNNQILFLDTQSCNIFVTETTIPIKEKYEQELNLIFNGTLFSDIVLKNPVSMCIDDNQNIYIAQISNEVIQTLNFPQLKNYGFDIHSSNEITPFNLMRINIENKIVEYNMLQKMPELNEKQLIASTIVFWEKYLVVAFLKSPTLLFINSSSLNESSLQYFFSELKDDIIDLGVFNNSLWVLNKNEILEYHLDHKELLPIKNVNIMTVSEYSDLFFRERDNFVFLFDPQYSEKKKPQIFKLNLNTLTIDSIPANSVYYVFSLQNEKISEVFAFKKTSQKMQKELQLYQDIYQIQ